MANDRTHRPPNRSPESQCPSWCGGHVPAGTAVVHMARVAVARHENLKCAVMVTRRDDGPSIGEPLISVSFKAGPGPLMTPRPIDFMSVGEALELAGRWDDVRSADMAGALRSAVALVEDEIEALIERTAQTAGEIFARRYDARTGVMAYRLIKALLLDIAGDVERDEQETRALFAALRSGDLATVERAIKSEQVADAGDVSSSQASAPADLDPQSETGTGHNPEEG